MTARIPTWVPLLLTAALLGLVASSCEGPAQQELRLRKVEGSLRRVSGLASNASEQLVVLQTEEKGTDAELAALKASLDELTASIESLRKDLAAAKTTDASLQKKLDDLSKKVDGVDQRLWVLEARYNDHLRKYHGG